MDAALAMASWVTAVLMALGALAVVRQHARARGRRAWPPMLLALAGPIGLGFAVAIPALLDVRAGRPLVPGALSRRPAVAIVAALSTVLAYAGATTVAFRSFAAEVPALPAAGISPAMPTERVQCGPAVSAVLGTNGYGAQFHVAPGYETAFVNQRLRTAQVHSACAQAGGRRLALAWLGALAAYGLSALMLWGVDKALEEQSEDLDATVG